MSLLHIPRPAAASGRRVTPLGDWPAPRKVLTPEERKQYQREKSALRRVKYREQVNAWRRNRRAALKAEAA